MSSMDNKKVKYEQHNSQKLKCTPWLVCRNCRLVCLNNEATRKEIKRGHVAYE